jgi:predicted permease
MVTPAYFTTLGITLRAGRFFTDQDRFGGENVAIVNESFAKKLFPNESALDHAFVTGPNSDIVTRIVGVIRDVKAAGLAAPPPDEIYYPRDQRGGAFMTVVGQARPGLRAAAVIPVLRRLLAELDPNVALATPQTMDDLVSQSVGVQRVTMALLICFAAIAALLAAVGVYSVMAYAVTQRTGEIGVRMALGASHGDILRLVLRAGAAQVGLGLALGVGGAFAASRLLTQALYEVKPFDPAVFAVVAVFFAAVSAVACLIPARRATRVDPMVALRVE